MRAQLHRMVLPTHVCPYGEQALKLLQASGYEVEDHHLKTREETDVFKAQHGVDTTPLIYIDDELIGGFDDLRTYLAKKARESRNAPVG